MEENRFYVYAYLDPRKPGEYSYGSLQFCFEPFYIGKGSFNRDKEHFRPSEIKRNYNPHKNRKINKIKDAGLDTIILRINENIDELTAFKLEIEYIAAIGREKDGGPLTNLYDGGFGSSKNDEVRQKIRKSVQEWHNTHISPCLGKICSDETKAKISQRHKGRKIKAESIEKMRQTKRAFPPKNKLHWVVTSPDGDSEIVYGLKEFCEKHGLHTTHMIGVANHKRRQHKGWLCRKLVDE